MDLLKFQASIDAHTAALNTHSGALEKFMAVAASGGAATSGEAPRGRGRPTNAEKAAQAAQSAPASVVATQVAQQSAVVAQVTATPSAATVAIGAQAANAAAANAQTGPLTHQGLAPKVVAFAKAKGRDALVALLGEFGAAEFAKIPADALPLFNDRLDGKAQTPTIASDLGNLLGL
jgi:hypothetical protein